jgi:hypothetical protein
MKIITDWDDETKKCKLAQARDIATKNRQRFFSKDFFDQVTGELKINFVNAFKELEQGNNYRPWIDRWEKLIKDPEVIDYLEQLENDPNSSSRSRIEFVLDLARQKLIL